MSRKSGRKNNRKTRRSQEVNIQQLEERTLLSCANSTFADPGRNPIERATRAELERNVQSPEPTPAFLLLDKNTDGRLVPAEVTEPTWNRIVSADANENCEISLPELLSRRERDEGNVRRPGPQVAFDRLDRNDDGQLTRHEVSPLLWGVISAVDANEDGGVTLQELLAAREHREDRIQRPGPADVFEQLDVNSDGQLTSDEVAEQVWTRLVKADANEDGGVTLQELQDLRDAREDRAQRPGPADVFARLDVNGDHQLTADEVSERIWAKLSHADANNDGGVTLEELKALRDHREDRSRRPNPQAVFEHLDINDDGQLTADEVSELVWRFLSQADADGNGGVTLEELRALRNEREVHVQRPGPAEVFARLDINEDGQLTADEVSELVWRALSHADANEDGGVTLQELRQWREQNEDKVRRPSPADVFARLDVNEDGQLTPDEVSELAWRALSQADANEDGAVTLHELRRWREEHEDRVRRPSPADVFARLDVNEDGRLTADEVSEEVWPALSRADANDDGGVTLQELREWREHNEDKVRRPTAADVFDHLDVNDDGKLTADEVNEHVWREISRADADNDRAVTLHELRRWREEREDRVRRPSPADVFARLDVNEDGRLTADEVSEEVWRALSRADANDDGGVTLQELREWREQHEDQVQRPTPADVFARLDLNDDGRLTADEVSEEVWRALSRANANEDGAVTLHELRRWREEHEDRVRRPNPADVFERLDLNDDGRLTADEVSADVWRILSKADTDKDGAVTIEELRALREEHEDRVRRPNPTDVFSELDTNNDGQLTADEVTEEIWQQLARADADGNGGVTLQELKNYRDHQEDRVRRPEPAEVFDHLDVNGDGQLTADEVSDAVWQKLSQADTNGDGGVTREELRAAREAHERRSQRPNPGDAFDHLDVNEDGSLTADEVGEQAWRRIARADADGDGAVTKAELHAAHEDHRRQIRWEQKAAAASYEIWINDASNQPVMREDKLTGTDFSILHLDDGDYYMWVQDETADGSGPWRERKAFTVVGGEVAVEASAGTLQWNAIDGAVTYEIWIASAETNRRVNRATGLNTISYALPQLPDGDYYYWIQAEDENGRGSWTGRQAFSVQNAALVVLSSPGSISWEAIPDTASYEVWLTNSETNRRVLRQAGIVETSFELPGLADGTYHYWIQGENADGDGAWSKRQTLVVKDGALVDLSPVGTLTWEAKPNAVTYEVWIADDAGKRAARQHGIDATSFEVPYLADGNYSWWLQSEDENGRGPWSRKREFTVTNGQIQVPVSVGTLAWPADANAATYEIWISDAGGNNRPLVRAAGLTTNSFALPELANGDYDYWIQSEGENGRGAWTRKMTFSVVEGQLITSSNTDGSTAAVDAIAAEIAVNGIV